MTLTSNSGTFITSLSISAQTASAPKGVGFLWGTMKPLVEQIRTGQLKAEPQPKHGASQDPFGDIVSLMIERCNITEADLDNLSVAVKRRALRQYPSIIHKKTEPPTGRAVLADLVSVYLVSYGHGTPSLDTAAYHYMYRVQLIKDNERCANERLRLAKSTLS